MGHRIELDLEELASPHLIECAIHARPRATESSREHFGRCSPTEQLIDLALCQIVQWWRDDLENGPIWMISIVGLQRGSHRLRSAPKLSTNPPRDLGQPPRPADHCHPASATDDFLTLGLRKLLEPRPAQDLL